MGSLASRPKLPKMQQPTYITIPTPVTSASAISNPVSVSAPVSSSPSEGNSDSGDSSSGTKSSSAEVSLLSRRRGRLSTVLTGFRGVLGQSSKSQPRKTLLGE